jgi:hypothetical protein
MRPSRANKIDANQAAIIEALEKTGATVQTLGAVGNGCPDLLVGRLGLNLLLECKVGAEDLNDGQREWHSRWHGQVVVVRDEYEAMKLVLKLSNEFAEWQAVK